MATSATSISSNLIQDASIPVSDTPKLRALEWLIGLPALGTVLFLVATNPGQLQGHIGDLVAWLLIVVAIDLLPVRYSHCLITMSIAVLLAAGMVFSVGEVGVLAFFGSVDSREIRREVSLARSLFNRGQIAFSAMAAAATFHLLGGDIHVWPAAIWAAAAGTAVDAAVNLFAVSLGPVVAQGQRLSTAFRYLFRELLLEAPAEAALGYFGLASLALLFAAAYAYQGIWGLLAALVPVGLVRQAFAHRQSVSRARSEIVEGREMLRVADTKHAQDVREERARLAIDLHDEVLPALFKVHLMGQVLKLDLDSGRLLDVDQDLLQLLDATDRAAEEMRAVISSLRRTSLDRGGVTPTLELLAKDLSRDSKISIELDTSEIGCAPLTQLLIYQVAREALRNAMKHSEADRIVLRLHREGRGARLTVSDDGRGFSLDTPAADGHFGLQMMRERVRMAGGEITIQSQPGEGTEIIARFPQDVPTE